MKTIDPARLIHVSGGFAGSSPQPLQPLRMPNMGAPKYSAAWWDFVRARGLDK